MAGPAGGASAGGNYGGNVNADQRLWWKKLQRSKLRYTRINK